MRTLCLNTPSQATHHPGVIKHVAAIGVHSQPNAHRLVNTLLPLAHVAVGAWGRRSSSTHVSLLRTACVTRSVSLIPVSVDSLVLPRPHLCVGLTP